MEPGKQSNSSEQQVKLDEMVARIEKVYEDPSSQEALNFIQERTLELTETSEKSEISLATNKLNQGFIHPETKMIRNYMVDPFLVDDPDIYRLLLEKISVIKKMPGWETMSVRQVLPTAIQTATNEYFGNQYSTSSTEAKNQAFYSEHSSSDSEAIHLRDFRGSNIAVCAEKSAVAQNLLAFSGFKTFLLLSSKCKIGDEKDRAHAYNVLQTSNGTFIFDPTNPNLTSKENGKITGIYPSIYKISEEEFQSLKDGGSVEVEHKEKVTAEEGTDIVDTRITKRIYGGV